MIARSSSLSEAAVLRTAIAKASSCSGKDSGCEGRSPAPGRLRGGKAQHYAVQSKLLIHAGQQIKLYARAVEVLAADAANPIQVGLSDERQC